MNDTRFENSNIHEYYFLYNNRSIVVIYIPFSVKREVGVNVTNSFDVDKVQRAYAS